MAVSLKQVTVAPKGMGLNDFVAQQEGFFAAEGLDVDVRLEDVPRHAVELEGPRSISSGRRTGPTPRTRPR